MQGRIKLEGGIGRATEVEEDVDPLLARTFLAEPNGLLDLDCQVVQDLKK